MDAPYVVLESTDIEQIPDLTGTETRLWIYLLGMVAADNCVYLHTMLRLDVQKKLGFNQNTLSKTLTSLQTKGIVKKTGRSIVEVLKGKTAVVIHTGLHAKAPHIRKLPGVAQGTPPQEDEYLLPGQDQA